MKRFVLALAAATAVAVSLGFTSSHAANSTRCLVSNRAAWGVNYDQPGGAGANCSYGTTLTFTNTSFVCTKPLAQYGTLPLRVIVRATGPWSGATAGAMILSSGCSGDNNPDTIDLIVYVDMKGAVLDQWGNGQDAAKYNGTGPKDLEWTGEFQCGHEAPGAHQDALQMQATGGNVSLVNGKTGFWNTGMATCLGAGGAIFYSSANGHFPAPPTNVLGGQYIACGKGLYGGNDVNHGGGYPVQNTGRVDGASFRAGRKDGSDPNCGASKSGGTPLAGGDTLTMTNLVGEKWDKTLKTWVRVN
jgi:hypothetical protein